jgi:hypothetical protein
MYILYFDQKSCLRGDFGISQSGPKGVISEIGFVRWGYAYILSMGKDRVRVINTSGFFCAAHGASMDRN